MGVYRGLQNGSEVWNISKLDPKRVESGSVNLSCHAFVMEVFSTSLLEVRIMRVPRVSEDGKKILMEREGNIINEYTGRFDLLPLERVGQKVNEGLFHLYDFGYKLSVGIIDREGNRLMGMSIKAVVNGALD